MLINSTTSTHLLPPIESTLRAVDLSQCNLSPAQKQRLLDLLHDYGDLFAIDGGPLRRTSLVKHAIHTEGQPIRQPNC